MLDVFSDGRVMYRFIEIDKISTADKTGGGLPRSYRYGYGVMDLNLNFIRDPGEKRVYFEISEYSTKYAFYEHPKK